ncbi:MAG: DUF423 domain-containing protein [Candidatus Marinimicrobia bacterium]|nr:DUF423 domain-containing protein [Candidatus Neomarinimicrobiota bacterium]
MMNWMAVGALFAFLGVALGAFGAHALRTRITPRDLEIFDVAVRYQLTHALALLITGLILWWRGLDVSRLLVITPWLFTAGIILFSGSLYVLVLTGKRWLGAVTPLGGVLFLAGWLLLALALWQK